MSLAGAGRRSETRAEFLRRQTREREDRERKRVRDISATKLQALSFEETGFSWIFFPFHCFSTACRDDFSQSSQLSHAVCVEAAWRRFSCRRQAFKSQRERFDKRLTDVEKVEGLLDGQQKATVIFTALKRFLPLGFSHAHFAQPVSPTIERERDNIRCLLYNMI